MKRLIIILIVIVAIAMPVAAQFNFDGFNSAFTTFATDVASGLAFNTTVGLNWSKAYIGNFPHLGFGFATGFTTVPFAATAAVVEDLFGATLPAEVTEIAQTYGFPLPAMAGEARLGGFGLPFDIGVKYGFWVPELNLFLPPDVTVDYMLAGADIRLQLIEEKFLLPLVSVGGGVNVLEGGFAVAGLLGGDQNIDLPTDPPQTLTLTDPAVAFEWSSFVIDLKIQASKTLFIITPYIGLGSSLGFSNAGGGLASTVKLGGTEITDAELEQIKQDMEDAGYPVPNFTKEGFIVRSGTTGWSFRAFGGVALNILILKLDVTGLYDITSGAVGASFAGRIRL